MYGITDDIITVKEIFLYLTEEDIFRLIFKEIPKGFITSPFREDKNPACYFERDKKGVLRFVDFGNSTIINGVVMRNINCFSAVKVFYNLDSFYDTLEFIYDILIKGKELPKRQINYYPIIFNEDKIKKEKRILISPRDFNFQDSIFWSKFKISRQNLIEDKVFPIKNLKILNSKVGDIDISINSATYAYTEFKKERKKIYFPYSKRRFISTCSENDIGSINHISFENKKLIITKSYKDCRVLRNLGRNSIWFQNEGMFPEDSLLIPLINNFDMISLFYDNDKTGYESSKKLKEKITNLSSITVNNISLPEESKVKDAGEAIHKIGENFLNNFLNGNNT